MIADTWNLRRIRRLDPLAALDDEAPQSKLDRIARHRIASSPLNRKISKRTQLRPIPPTVLLA